MEVKFSIITPVYNVEKYLDECIQSVLAQTYENYELILVNDGSKDRSGDICDKYAAEHPQIQIYHKENKGQLHTREFAIQHATGDFYVFLDSDDYLEPHALATIHQAIEQYNCDCVMYGMQRVADNTIFGNITEKETILLTDKKSIYNKLFFNTAYNPLCRKAIRASSSRKVDYSSFYHVRHGEDLLQSIELMEQVSRLLLIPDVLYDYRINPQSVTQSVRYENYKVDFSVRQYIAVYIKRTEIFTEEDLVNYRSYAIRLLIDEIDTIAQFDTAFKNKCKLFDEIAQTEYYQSFIANKKFDKSKTGKKLFLFVLFQRRWYRAIDLIMRMVSMLRK